jgi:hypothetical protein
MGEFHRGIMAEKMEWKQKWKGENMSRSASALHFWRWKRDRGKKKVREEGTKRMIDRNPKGKEED